MGNQVTMTPQRETNNALITEPKEMENYELSGKELRKKKNLLKVW